MTFNTSSAHRIKLKLECRVSGEQQFYVFLSKNGLALNLPFLSKLELEERILEKY